LADRLLRSPAVASNQENEDVAKVSPGEFLRQVRTESARIVWPTRRETVMTGIMVLIMTSLLAIFFFGVDSIFRVIVRELLGLLS
jgi:preprotein translocase subunit SecE